MSTVFVEREVTLTDGGAGFVRVYQPEPSDRCWSCRLHFVWGGSEQEQEIYGEDSYQALLLAMQIAPVFIAGSAAYKEGRLKVFDSVLRDRDPRDSDNRTYLQHFFDVRSQLGDVQ